MSTPATRGSRVARERPTEPGQDPRLSSNLTRAPGAFGRILVGAQAEERRLAELVARGPLRVRDLGDELRPHPGGTAAPGRRREWTARRAQAREPRAERRQRLAGVAGADLADELEVATLIEADEERAELLAAPGRRCVAADHELGLLADLDLSPRARARVRFVARSLVLRDDPLPALLARDRVRLFAVARQPSRKEDRPGGAREEPLERGSALREGPGAERPPVHLGRQRREHRSRRDVHPPPGSPVAAFATSPPSSRAIPASRRRVSTERGLASAIRVVEA